MRQNETLIIPMYIGVTDVKGYNPLTTLEMNKDEARAILENINVIAEWYYTGRRTTMVTNR